MVRHTARSREMINACNIIVRKYDGKRPRGIRTRRWVYNIKAILKEELSEVVN